MKKIGFIGYGLRSETLMKAFTGAGLPLAPAAVADPRLETLQPQLARDGRFADTRYYADAEEMLDREALDAVFIGTRCGLHARYAALVMERGLPLFLEKPVCIDEAQYARLLAAPPRAARPRYGLFPAARHLHRTGDEAPCGQRRAG